VQRSGKSLVKLGLTLSVLFVALSLVACLDDNGVKKPFYWDAALTDEYVPEPTRYANGELDEEGRHFENKYGSVIIPEDWIIGKDRNHIDVKNLANGGVFKAGDQEGDPFVVISINKNYGIEPAEFADWFNEFFTSLYIYTFEPDQNFGGNTYLAVSFSDMWDNTAYKLEYLSDTNTMVVIEVHNATLDDPTITKILNSIKVY
jgi:hypothetical protein